MNSTTIAAIIQSRTERGLADLLLTVYDAGYCAGGNLPIEEPAHTGLADLLILLEARHRQEVLALRGWLDPPITANAVPGWLLSLAQQADSVQLRAAVERETALGDARPPEQVRR